MPEIGLRKKSWIKTSLAPGSQVVTDYLKELGLLPYLEKLGFNIVGYGCTTCIGNSGPLDKQLKQEIIENNLNVSSVLSGNRNFEGRVHPYIKSNWLAFSSFSCGLFFLEQLYLISPSHLLAEI